MQFFTLVISALAATALAAPTHPDPTTPACGGAGCTWTTSTKPAETTTTTAPGCGGNGCEWTSTKPAETTTTTAPGCGGDGCEWTSTTAHPPATTTAGHGGGSYNPCADEGLYKVAQCCSTDVLGLIDVDCQNPTSAPSSASNFQQTCKAVGQRARCCLLPVLGQALVCKAPIGVN